MTSERRTVWALREGDVLPADDLRISVVKLTGRRVTIAIDARRDIPVGPIERPQQEVSQ